MRYIIRDQEVGYLMKDGRFMRLLPSGKYSFVKMAGYEVLKVTAMGEVKTCDIPVEVLMQDEAFRSRVVKVEIPDECIAIRFVNQAYKEVLTKQEAYYWNIFEKNTFQLADMTEPDMTQVLPRIYLDLMPSKYYKKITVKDGEVGLLYFDNHYERKLTQGSYYFWNYGREVTGKICNMKIQQLEVNGQEILTADKVSVRLNVMVNYRIVDPERLVQMTEGIGSLLYTYTQLTLREYVGRFQLDELLQQKEEISQYICRKLKEQQEAYCVEITAAGIKDIILPGEIREIMNTVLIAEKKAQANVIMRREEVASTRSLMNTARLMEENQTLYRLKEMEYLERICDKVGNITVSGGRGVLEQLRELMN